VLFKLRWDGIEEDEIDKVEVEESNELVTDEEADATEVVGTKPEAATTFPTFTS
jgi:hypothetical protein